MDLGNLRRDHQSSDLEQLVRSHIAIANDLPRLGWVAEAAVCVRSLRSDSTEFSDKRIMLASEQVVQETEADGPIVGKSSRFLSRPFGIDWGTRIKYRQVSGARLTGHRNQKQLRRIGWVALHALARGVIVAIQLRGIPPGSIRVAHCLRRARQIRPAARGECVWW